MSRKRTGLRNRYRTALSTYSLKHKGRQRDTYGKWDKGQRDHAEIVAGSILTYKPYMGALKTDG